MKILGIDIESTKMAKKLRAIAKHANKLADELDAIEDEWQCECGAVEYVDIELYTDNNSITRRTCMGCKEEYVVSNDDGLPTRFEGSD